MGTRSFIGRLNEDGSVDAIYCHFDGYAYGVGFDLCADFDDPAKVDRLIEQGGRSSLQEGKEYGELPKGAVELELATERDVFSRNIEFSSYPKSGSMSIEDLRLTFYRNRSSGNTQNAMEFLRYDNENPSNDDFQLKATVSQASRPLFARRIKAIQKAQREAEQAAKEQQNAQRIEQSEQQEENTQGKGRGMH